MTSPSILAFDTSTELCSVALLRGGEFTACEEELGSGAAERILPMIDELLRAAAIRLGDLDAIGFGRGPGGFTGVRLATSIAQGLGFGAGRRLVPVSDLQALAEHALALDSRPSHVLVCSDARMREVYWAVYARSGGGSAELLGTEHVGGPDSVTVDAALACVAGAGRGFRAYPALAARLAGRLIAVHENLLPRAREIAAIAVREWRAGRTLPPAAALPVYLRDDVARRQPPGGSV